MGLIFDALIVLIAVFSILRGIKRGFADTVLRTAALVGAIILSASLCKSVGAQIKKSDLYEKTRISICETVSDALKNAADENKDEDEDADAEENAFERTLGVFGIRSEKRVKEYEKDIIDRGIEAASERIADELSSALASVMSILITFALSLALLSIAALIVKLICSLPVLEKADKILGGTVGAAGAYLWGCAISTIVVRLSEVLENAQVFSGLAGSAYLMPLINRVNVFEMIINAIFGA